jgi:hypothetical protein
MATSVRVTIDEALHHVGHLIAAGDDAGALAYAHEVLAPLLQSMTPEQIGLMSGLLSSAERAVSYAAYERETAAQCETSPQTD